jgi:ATP-dependent Lon protease
MLPARNRQDLEEVPEQARAQLAFIFLDDVEQALRGAIDMPQSKQPAAGP